MEHIKSMKEGDGSSRSRKGVIAVDFDGVIHGYSKGYQNGVIYDDPVPGAREAMEKIKSLGYKVWIFSARDNEQAIKEYLEKNNIHFDRVHMGRKPPSAEIFIDDRAINFSGDWDKTLQEVQTFVPWLKKNK